MDELEKAVEETVEKAEAEGLGEALQQAEEVAAEVKKNSVGKEILSWILTIAVAVAAALIIRTFIFEPVRVDGHSMCDTLQDKEIMFTTRYDYWLGKPQFGDVVICNYPGRISKGLFGIQSKTKFVKRVMGVPGDTIEIKNFQLYRNGEAIDQSFLTPERNSHSLNAMMFGPVTLGENEYLVMGDNRDNSNDSRYIGPISEDMILGHVRFVFFPFKAARAIH